MTADWSVDRADAVAALMALPARSVDLVCMDPAYESLERHRRKGTTTRLAQSDGSSNEWFDIFPNTRLPDLIGAMYDVLKPERHAYVLCDEETSDVVKSVATSFGFYVWKTLVWVKTLSATVGKPLGDPSNWTAAQVATAQVRRGMGYHFAACTERIVFLEKRSVSCVKREVPSLFSSGTRIVADLEPKRDPPGRGRQLRAPYLDVLFAPRITGYPTEKPVTLLRTLIDASTEPGELVVDPFCGSGSTGEAAIGLGRRVKLYDNAEKAVNLTRTRLDAFTRRTE